jgi:hypothetical protein
MIERPDYYRVTNIEAIDVIEAWKLGFHLGNVIKYVARDGQKEPLIDDLKKARWYLDRYIDYLEGAENESGQGEI